jgi:hypothetical protein
VNYKFTFEKISPQHEFAGVGFAGNIFIILNALNYLNDNDKLFVDMETNDCVCTEKASLLFDTNNCWEYYFDQIKIDNNFQNLNYHLPPILKYDDKAAFLNPEIFTHLKKKFYNSFKLKPYLVKKIDEYYSINLKNKTTLGVQIRLTDMKQYHNVSPLNRYIEKINNILLENPSIQQLFLATDDGSIIQTLSENINVPVLYHNDMSRASVEAPNLNPYDRYKNGGENHMYNLSMECLIEILTLTKCDYLLKADISALSITASILSENIKQVYKL